MTPNKTTFRKRLFVYFFSIFLAFSLVIGFYQFRREKEFRIQKLNKELTIYNKLVYNFINADKENINKLADFTKIFPEKDVRITIIDLSGEVIFDTATQKHLTNHLDRPEVADALKYGTGTSIRSSDSTNKKYFYSAMLFNRFFVRTALPYDVDVIDMLGVDKMFFYFLFILFGLTVILLLFISNNLGKSISHLRDFAINAEANEPIKENIKFPSDELGEISSYIVQIYKKLRKTRDDLYKEREKLYKHLQISNEGLAIFSPEKKEILANNHFIQYINVISDKQSASPDEVFELPEFELLNDFITENVMREMSKSKVLRERIILNKNGKTFVIKAIIFQDNSFEISINDVTQQEEENQLKRQLTQNVAHELKTPVSSIQGYLETIINNPNLNEEKKQFFIERSYFQAIRLSALVSDISLLNKMDEAAVLFDCETVNIKEIVAAVFSDISLQIETKKVSVNIYIDEETTIKGNRSLLYSIFRNLADNSLAYAGEEFCIILTCYREDQDFYYFSYADTGVGVPEEHLNRLFERFYRVDQGRSRKIGGTGLGLSIVKNAILFHKGRIAAKNRAEGGLEFLFTLKKK
jgi:signal transduction histidine kinase